MKANIMIMTNYGHSIHTDLTVLETAYERALVTLMPGL